MMRPGHHRWHRAVEAYVDGELPSPRREAVLAHLARCVDCDEDADLLRLVKRSLRSRRTRITPLAAARIRRLAAGVPAAGDR
jgi:anti-sigma factor RsiW